MFLNKIARLLLTICFSVLFLAAKPIKQEPLRLIVFQGSDWCAQCILFEKNILSDSLFIRYAKKNQISIERIDFPQRLKLDSATQVRNERMADKFNFQGQFPTVLLANTDDSTLLKVIPKRNLLVNDFIAMLNKNMPQLE